MKKIDKGAALYVLLCGEIIMVPIFAVAMVESNYMGLPLYLFIGVCVLFLFTTIFAYVFAHKINKEMLEKEIKKAKECPDFIEKD